MCETYTLTEQTTMGIRTNCCELSVKIIRLIARLKTNKNDKGNVLL